MPRRNTVNINPEKPTKLDMETMYARIKENFKTRLKTSIAIVFIHKNYEITLFNGGRVLIKNVPDEQTAAKIYTEINKK